MSAVVAWKASSVRWRPRLYPCRSIREGRISAFLGVRPWTRFPLGPPTHCSLAHLFSSRAWSSRVVPVSFPSPFLLLRSAPVACFVLLSRVPIGGCYFSSNCHQDSERPIREREREAVMESKMQVDKTRQVKFFLLYASPGITLFLIQAIF
jgi:hypothetical protein